MNPVPDVKKAKFTNRLIHETSPYLRQHAHNPVDWHPWDPAALELAKQQNKPILLSVGYSACHWCHVMERESFENENIARIMNQCFVNVKVDREERPDLDSIYMNYVQMTTGSGGWPMTVFLTPDQVPFFGGTYFPPDDRYGRPGFPKICLAVYEAYQQRRTEIEKSAPDIVKSLQGMNQLPDPQGLPGAETLSLAYRNLAQRFDLTHGGFGGAPKFPGSMSLAFCLRHYHRTGFQPALDFIQLSLEKMALGGIYDQLGGGFHRYSVDDHWLVPHFEKMLYDNALLSRLYLDAFQQTGNPLYRRITEEILDYVRREMTHPEGGFYSTQDADSEGEEGKFFVWTLDEIESILGKADSQVFCRYFDVSRSGNFEGKNILNVPLPLHAFAARERVPIEELQALVERGRKQLFAEREKRVKPHRDEKILTSWNGLMLASFATTTAVLQRADYLQTACQNARFVLDHLKQEGKLLRTFKDGQAKLNGYLEDYAYFVEGLLALFQASGDPQWLDHAVQLNETLLDQFWDNASASFYLTGRDHEKLIARVKDFYDNATPAGSSVAVFNLLKLAVLTGETEYRKKAEANLSCMRTALERHPGGFGYLLEAADFCAGPVREIAILGSRQDDRATRQLTQVVYQRYLPNKIVVVAEPDTQLTSRLPLLQERGLVEGKPTAYVCQNYSCQRPVTTPVDLEALVRE
ncbi:MAG: thioredoxin domain-containing protein [Acidobacteria bacterium]|nr:thioredoxin domain-containing protein [Acidobacteriota bacterium]MCI0621292.1 thioredoxin domain-containing protein [Acidobacteriota bacterium]MCI0723732.1 thioredoxin domain-containing protein [Acidobacteriota bacterium]